MKRIANGGIIVILTITALGFYRLRTAAIDQADSGRESGVLKIVTRVNAGHTESIKISTTGVDINGKATRIDFPDTDARDVEVRLAPSVKFKDEHLDGTFWVTIKAEEPLVLSNKTYENIWIGMTCPQVGEALGGVMTRGRMSDGFWSKLELIQGKRRIYLKFADGKVTEKSAKDLE